MMLLLRGAALTASRSTLSESGLAEVGRMTPLRLPRDDRAGRGSGEASPHPESRSDMVDVREVHGKFRGKIL